MKLFKLLLILVAAFHAVNGQDKAGGIHVAEVWAGHPVGFDLLTTGDFQYVCYYDKERNMVIAQRSLDSESWKRTILPSRVQWDSHNYINVAVDKEGYIHVSGNMHNVPIIYFRSANPENIDVFEKLPMTGKNEDQVSYPAFFKDQAGNLYFQYRNGSSGKGITFWNKYDPEHKKWTSAFDTPLFNGEEEASAYMSSLTPGPDGYFYMIWMWRLSPIANTNHNLCLIRTKDLEHWENIRGEVVELPVRWSDNTVIADPVGPWNGLINMGFRITWDQENRPCISYHKYDGQGVSQVYISRWENNQWKTYEVSDWPDYTWDIDRGGSLINEVGIASVRPEGEDALTVDYFHKKYGPGTWILDGNTLMIRKRLPPKESRQPVKPGHPEEGMTGRQLADNTGAYVMKWQTLPANQDRARKLQETPSSELKIYRIQNTTR